MSEAFDTIYQELDPEGTFRDELATVDKSGKRKWLFPTKPNGKFYNYRKAVSYLLLAILLITPWVWINRKPLFLFNILESKFILFGFYFAPQDNHLFVIAMLIAIIAIALFTVVFGRLFCGWVCPQTIFMEMVYRRIEYWIEGDANAQKRLSKAPWNGDKIWKRVLKHAIFFLIAVVIANTFLAYIIGREELLKIITEPIAEHYQGFIAMIIFSLVFYFVFARLREQVCTTICPYGRLQGVLLDDKSLAVYYDFERGEPRGRIKKGQVNPELGDCIDCGMCVRVCPTGIDIRNGIQLECVNCTACMDACDDIMRKVNRPEQLIRIDSLEGIKSGRQSIINGRSIAYSSVLVILMILEGFLFMSRSEVETLILRTPGTLFYEKEEGQISNLYNYQLINKTDRAMDLRFEVKGMPATVEYVGKDPQTVPEQTTEGALFITIAKTDLEDRKTKLIVEAYEGDRLVDRTKTSFYGPMVVK